MDLQESGISSLPVPVTMKILSVWENQLKILRGKPGNKEEKYLAGEYALVFFILQQISGISQEQCLILLKNTPFFEKAYNNILGNVEKEQIVRTHFQPAFERTKQVLIQFKHETLPFTFLGTFFEQSGIFGENKKTLSARNATGSFYTPAIIAQFIVEKTIEIGNFSDSIDKIRCLDPACGGGIFLVALAETLLRSKLNGSTNNHNAKVDCIRNILTQQIWGIDFSPNAQRVSQLQLILWALSLVPKDNLRDICSWVEHCTQGDFLSNTRNSKPNFSVIVGNPPFGNLLSDEQKEDAKGWATTRTREISELFLERALGILNPGGCLGFVMPKTMAYYAQWARARALILPAKLAGVADLGLSFPGVNFETLALFTKDLPAIEKRNHFPIFAVNQGVIGTFPREYIRETGLIPLQPLSPDEETFLETVRHNSVSISRLVPTRQIIRGIYVSEEEKAECKAGDLLWINRVPDIQHYALTNLWEVDPGVISLANPSRLKVLQCPKVLLKVLRGRNLSGVPDPWGILIPTEKLVSILLDKCSHREILAWNACLNSWPASYYLQKVIFSGTTESARVLDYPYLKHVPVVLHKSQTINVLSGINLALLLASQIQTQFPALISPTLIPALGALFQQVIFLTYAENVPKDPRLSLEGEFESDLILLRDLLITGAKKPPRGGLSRNNLATFPEIQESTEKNTQALESPIRDFVQQVEALLLRDIVHEIKALAEQNQHWHMLVKYFNARF